jgi:alanyl-tRNA synthetase
VKEEEDAFLRTLDKGLKRIEETIGSARSAKSISGAVAFEALRYLWVSTGSHPADRRGK